MMPYLYTRCLALCGVALLIGAVSSCKKDAPAALDANTTALVSHSWRIITYVYTDDTAIPRTTVNVYPGSPSYWYDDTYRFNADNSLTFEDGQAREKATDVQVTAGKWEFQNNQTNLNIALDKTVALGTIGSGNSSTYGILKLSTDTLRITRSFAPQKTFIVTLVK